MFTLTGSPRCCASQSADVFGLWGQVLMALALPQKEQTCRSRQLEMAWSGTGTLTEQLKSASLGMVGGGGAADNRWLSAEVLQEEKGCA